MKNVLHVITVATIAAVVAAGAIVAGAQREREREDYNSGEHLYLEFCASCHGRTGKGDGAAAATLPRGAADLTQIARRNGGVFPRQDVLALLEGTRPLAAHAIPTMPNWRQTLSRLERGNERAVRERLEAIVEHVEGLQRRTKN